MGLKSKGGFRIGGVEYMHPLSSDEISYLLQVLKHTSFPGDQLENLTIVTLKLQDEYNTVLEKEQKTA